ncbi:MAG: hypothetical protein ACLSG5_14340 [Oscillospiraceae bacterium]
MCSRRRAEFVKVVQTDSGVTAVYSGDAECGLIGVDDSSETWSCGRSERSRIFSAARTSFGSEAFTRRDSRSRSPWTTYEYLPYGSRTVSSPRSPLLKSR